MPKPTIIYNPEGSKLPLTYDANLLNYLLYGSRDRDLVNEINARYAANLAQMQAQQAAELQQFEKMTPLLVKRLQATGPINAMNAGQATLATRNAQKGALMTESDFDPARFTETLSNINQTDKVLSDEAYSKAIEDLMIQKDESGQRKLERESGRNAGIAVNDFRADQAKRDRALLTDSTQDILGTYDWNQKLRNFNINQIPFREQASELDLEGKEVSNDVNRALLNIYRDPTTAKGGAYTLTPGTTKFDAQGNPINSIPTKEQQAISGIQSLLNGGAPTGRDYMLGGGMSMQPTKLNSPSTQPSGPLSALGLSTNARNGGVKDETIESVIINLAPYPGALETFQRKIAEFQEKNRKK